MPRPDQAEKDLKLAPEMAGEVPREYRAQVEGRCQRQFIPKPKDPPPGWTSDIEAWIEEWVKGIDPKCPFRSDGLRLVTVQVDWRLISNSGVDEGIIRPVLGARGWPILPGSGIKGLFRRACSPEQALHWCGSRCADAEPGPGILRFHGAWPLDASWGDGNGRDRNGCGLLDVAHPQQNWQVGFEAGKEKHSAFGVVSLLRPRLCIGLSSTRSDLSEEEWKEITATLRRALERGLGGRTCVGYGTTGRLSGDVLFQCRLEGQGSAARLLNGEPEFRPTMFRAAIRGMALRLFGGLSDEATAQKTVNQLFGSVEGTGNVGLLATAYSSDAAPGPGTYGRGSWKQPVYATSGCLQWRLARTCRAGESEESLKELLACLHGITMALAGFGKGWRRPDHRIFHPRYGKTPIGCHWQWLAPETLPSGIPVQSGEQISALLRRARRSGRRWLEATGQRPASPAPWREVIHPEQMQIWVRRADGSRDAKAIHWFHKTPQRENPDPRDLKATPVGGQVNRVGLAWNRMLPLLDGSSPPSPTGQAPPRGAATARLARSSAAAMNRPGRRGAPAAPSPGEASITPWHGPYLESFVLFRDRRQQRLTAALENKLDEGAGAGFKRIRYEDQEDT